ALHDRRHGTAHAGTSRRRALRAGERRRLRAGAGIMRPAPMMWTARRAAAALLGAFLLIGLAPRPSNAQVVEPPVEMPARFIEPPVLAAQVDEGALPPIGKRLPNPPAVAAMDWPGQTPGRHGGTLNTLMGSAKD